MTEPQTFTFANDGAIPNSKLPLLVYRQAVPADPEAIERLFTANRWPAAWRDQVHPFHHFHSDAHEVLGVASGSAKVRFGGPAGQVLEVSAGDVVWIPPGEKHFHGATPTNAMVHVAIAEILDGKFVEWLEPVTDQQYKTGA